LAQPDETKWVERVDVDIEAQEILLKEREYDPDEESQAGRH
jgi:hypothetical protein